MCRLVPSLGLVGVLVLSALPPDVRTLRADEAPTPEVEEALARALDIEEELLATCAKVRRATVSVVNKRFRRDKGEIVPGEPARPVGVGSGVLIERKGRPWVITNVHVVRKADEVDVITIDGQTHAMTVHDEITQYDIALLAFRKRPRQLKPVQIDARVSRNLAVGSWVVATGNPFSMAMEGQCVTTLGVVSGKDRVLPGLFFYGNAIQHDAPVNPGNSGGPLWNLKGRLVGINGKISSWSQFRGARPSNTGASYSLPIHQVSEFLLAMIDRRTDARAGFLGLEVETSTRDDGQAIGARVKKVHERSPAGRSRAALRAGDLITRIFFMQAWHRIRTASDLTNLLALGPAGAFLKIRFKRGRTNFVWSGRLTAGAER